VGAEAVLEAPLALFVAGTTVSRRDVVRAVCASLPAGGPAAAVEAAADRVLASLSEVDAGRRQASGPGVGERRYALTGAGRARTPGERDRDLDHLLAARGMARAPEAGRARAGPGPDRGLG
jgi:hypothetical protein